MMGNRGILQTFLAVLVTTGVFYGFSSAGTFAFNAVVSPTKSFVDQTYIGPFDVTSLSEEEATIKLQSDFPDLHAKLVADLIYQDATTSLPAEIVTYDVDSTVARANSGEENSIIVEISEEGLRTVLDQNFTAVVFSEDDIASIRAGIEKELATGIMPAHIQITDYLTTAHLNDAEIATASITGLSPALSSAISSLTIDIAPNTPFSIIEFIDNNGFETLSNGELTVLASVMYAAVLQTNFEVVERNIGRSLKPSIEPGFEAAINRQLGLDFKFKNPNRSTFQLKSQIIDGALQISINGLPLLYTYTPDVVKVETFPPRTVRRFSASVPVGSIQVEDEGRDGMEVTVNRIISYDGTVRVVEQISSDFYAPIPKTEIHPIKKEDQPAPNTSPNGTDEPTDGTGTQTPPVDTSQGTGTETESTTPPKSADDIGNEYTKEPAQYDKGGNRIN